MFIACYVAARWKNILYLRSTFNGQYPRGYFSIPSKSEKYHRKRRKSYACVTKITNFSKLPKPAGATWPTEKASKIFTKLNSLISILSPINWLKSVTVLTALSAESTKVSAPHRWIIYPCRRFQKPYHPLIHQYKLHKRSNLFQIWCLYFLNHIQIHGPSSRQI